MKCLFNHYWTNWRKLAAHFSEFGGVSIRFRYCLECKKMQWDCKPNERGIKTDDTDTIA